MIAIIDYGAGNLKSVKKAFDFLGIESEIATAPEQMKRAEKIVLPGVGAFGAAVEKLQQSDFFEPLQKWLAQDKPFLGICLGMQLLMETSAESPDFRGLEFFKGDCLRFESGKVPQIGWNNVKFARESSLFKNIPDGSFFYFLHGFYLRPEDGEITSANSDYGVIYPAAVEKGNVFAVQFHPEKSGEHGLQLLKNWVEIC
ncbi:MAG: imidazole glycerol phosphate synthase subunit HisH [Calditrichaeota bacterium]|nr:imidazole glycerol phosphate synthase subunit HisH [Calditrichota bacterium]